MSAEADRAEAQMSEDAKVLRELFSSMYKTIRNMKEDASGSEEYTIESETAGRKSFWIIKKNGKEVKKFRIFSAKLSDKSYVKTLTKSWLPKVKDHEDLACRMIEDGHYYLSLTKDIEFAYTRRPFSELFDMTSYLPTKKKKPKNQKDQSPTGDASGSSSPTNNQGDSNSITPSNNQGDSNSITPSNNQGNSNSITTINDQDNSNKRKPPNSSVTISLQKLETMVEELKSKIDNNSVSIDREDINRALEDFFKNNDNSQLLQSSLKDQDISTQLEEKLKPLQSFGGALEALQKQQADLKERLEKDTKSNSELLKKIEDALNKSNSYEASFKELKELLQKLETQPPVNNASGGNGDDIIEKLQEFFENQGKELLAKSMMDKGVELQLNKLIAEQKTWQNQIHKVFQDQKNDLNTKLAEIKTAASANSLDDQSLTNYFTYHIGPVMTELLQIKTNISNASITQINTTVINKIADIVKQVKESGAIHYNALLAKMNSLPAEVASKVPDMLSNLNLIDSKQKDTLQAINELKSRIDGLQSLIIGSNTRDSKTLIEEQFNKLNEYLQTMLGKKESGDKGRVTMVLEEIERGIIAKISERNTSDVENYNDMKSAMKTLEQTFMTSMKKIDPEQFSRIEGLLQKENTQKIFNILEELKKQNAKIEKLAHSPPSRTPPNPDPKSSSAAPKKNKTDTVEKDVMLSIDGSGLQSVDFLFAIAAAFVLFLLSRS